MAAKPPVPWHVLLEPIRIGPLVAKNRIEAAPTLTCICNRDQSVTRELVEFYRVQAKGGAGIITVHETAIDADRAITQPTQLNLGDDFYIPGLAAIAEVIKDGGALASIQLNHGGRQAVSELNGGRNPIGPSAQVGRFTEDRRRGEQVVEEMTLGHDRRGHRPLRGRRLSGQAGRFRHGPDPRGTRLAHLPVRLAGRQQAHRRIRRQPGEPGPLRDRVVDAVRERCGADFPIEWRLSASDLVPGGLEIEDAVEYARLMQDRVDCFQVSAGMISELAPIRTLMPRSTCPTARTWSGLRPSSGRSPSPFAVVGAIMDRRRSASGSAAGKADIVAMCRALLADPQLPNKTFRGEEGRDHPLHPLQHLSARGVHMNQVRCTVNPRSVRGTTIAPSAAGRAEKVVVVGGGPAGMVAGITAAERGHEVVLFEKEDRLGGNLLISSGPPFKSDYRRYLDYLLAQVDRWAGRGALVVQVGVAGTPTGWRRSRRTC